MALSDSQSAIGAVTRLMQDFLMRRGFTVSIGKPEQAAATNGSEKLNLFLYETEFDGSLRNHDLQDDLPTPLWLTLKYLITAYDDEEQSDSADAHAMLGRGMSALHELNYLQLDAATDVTVRDALENNPEPLKITFDASTPDLLSKLMQGADEKYRLSAAFQVRPVMLLPSSPASYSLLVGVDYTQSPPVNVAEEGIGITVLPSMGPMMQSLEPVKVEPGEEFTIHGVDLHLAGLDCVLGATHSLMITSQRTDTLQVVADSQPPAGITEGLITSGAGLSAGEHPLQLRQQITARRFRGSAVRLLALLPIVNTAVLAAGTLSIDGILLGTVDDDILVALYRDGAVAHLYDTAVAGAEQKVITIASVAPVAGSYLVIVSVNGQQARNSPMLVIS